MSTIDQQQQNGNGWTAIAGTSSTPDRKAVAQTFIPSLTAEIANIKTILRSVGNPSGNVKCEIYDDSGGDPNNLLAEADSQQVATDINAEGEGAGWSEVNFAFTNGPTLFKGSLYHIVLSPSGVYTDWDSSNYVQWFTQNSDVTDSYSNGKSRKKDADNSWTDFPFYTYSDFYFAESVNIGYNSILPSFRRS